MDAPRHRDALFRSSNRFRTLRLDRCGEPEGYTRPPTSRRGDEIGGSHGVDSGAAGERFSEEGAEKRLAQDQANQRAVISNR